MKLKKHIYDENIGIGYTLKGDYYIPDFQLPKEKQLEIGRYGRMHAQYLKKHHKVIFNELLCSGKLERYLYNLDQQAQEQLDLLVEQYKQAEGVTEKLKGEDQMTWVCKMNSIMNRADEFVLHDLIYS